MNKESKSFFLFGADVGELFIETHYPGFLRVYLYLIFFIALFFNITIFKINEIYCMNYLIITSISMMNNTIQILSFNYLKIFTLILKHECFSH